MTGEEWTDRDLAVLGDLELRGLPPQEIAAQIGRALADVEDHLAIVRQRKGRPGSPQDATAYDDEAGGP